MGRPNPDTWQPQAVPRGGLDPSLAGSMDSWLMVNRAGQVYEPQAWSTVDFVHPSPFSLKSIMHQVHELALSFSSPTLLLPMACSPTANSPVGEVRPATGVVWRLSGSARPRWALRGAKGEGFALSPAGTDDRWVQ